jgi:methylenetetrahydrofolate reductase (NADPH)
LHSYKEAGITSILALRGDPTGGPSAPWTSTPGGFNHADELVQLADEFGGFTIGVAAFPDGHPASNGDFDKDVDVLIRKEELGATFATTQFFFEAKQYTRLVDALAARGSKLVIIPGILPVTNVKLLHRMAELGGTPIPAHIADAFAKVENDPHAVRELGVEIATSLCKELLAAGAPGLHFYTMNSSTATQEIYRKLNNAQ